MNSTMHESIFSELSARLPPSTRSREVHPSQLTVGVEHEMFLLHNGQPCNHAQSQALFETLIAAGWKPHIDPLSGLVDGVAVDIGGNGLAWIKYEYDPHLIEITTPYSSELADVAVYLATLWESLFTAAGKVDLCIASIPILDVVDRSALAAATRIATVRKLQSLRVLLLSLCGNNSDLAGFPAWIAATQVHVGGLPWLTRPEIISELYCQEPSVAAYAYQNLPHQSSRTLFARRWEGYRAVYGNTSLLGFPDFKNGWTLEAWIESLLDAPFLNGDNELSSAREIGEAPEGDWWLFLTQVRDLQLVKPRISGTLEFRGDPAQPSVEAILGVAEARLAACRMALHSTAKTQQFQASRQQWLSGEWLP